MSPSQPLKTKSTAQATCNSCKRFLPRNRVCTFCRADNGTLPTPSRGHPTGVSNVFRRDLSTSAEGATPGPSRYCSPPEVMNVLSELKSMVSSISARMDTLETKLVSLDVAVGSFEALSVRLDALFAEMGGFEKSLSSIDSLTHTTNRLSAMVEGVSAGHASLADRIAGLEGRCLALEGSAVRAPSVSPSPSVVDDLSSRLSGFERSQRDHELIVFGLPDVDGDSPADVSRCCPWSGVLTVGHR